MVARKAIKPYLVLDGGIDCEKTGGPTKQVERRGRAKSGPIDLYAHSSTSRRTNLWLRLRRVVSNRAWRRDTRYFFALKLSFDSRLIYNRPYSLNLFSPKFIEYIFGKGNSLPVYMEAKELSLWRTVEA